MWPTPIPRASTGSCGFLRAVDGSSNWIFEHVGQRGHDRVGGADRGEQRRDHHRRHGPAGPTAVLLGRQRHGQLERRHTSCAAVSFPLSTCRASGAGVLVHDPAGAGAPQHRRERVRRFLSTSQAMQLMRSPAIGVRPSRFKPRSAPRTGAELSWWPTSSLSCARPRDSEGTPSRARCRLLGRSGLRAMHTSPNSPCLPLGLGGDAFKEGGRTRNGIQRDSRGAGRWRDDGPADGAQYR